MELVLVSNGGLIQSLDERNGIQQTGTFSQQCMYISIYDYITLKQNYTGTFEAFKRSIDPNRNTPDNVEWDEFNRSHQETLRNAANTYNLDIRIWQRSFLDNRYLDQGIHFLEENFIRPRYREGAGKSHIVNIAANLRHFELIIGGSIFGNNDTYNTQIQAKNNREIQTNDNEFLDLYNDIKDNLNTGNAFDYVEKINTLKNKEYDALYAFELGKKESDLTEEEKYQITQSVDNYFKELVIEVEKLFLQVESNPNTTNNEELAILAQIEKQSNDERMVSEIDNIDRAIALSLQQEEKDRENQEERDKKIAEEMQKNLLNER